MRQQPDRTHAVRWWEPCLYAATVAATIACSFAYPMGFAS